MDPAVLENCSIFSEYNINIMYKNKQIILDKNYVMIYYSIRRNIINLRSVCCAYIYSKRYTFLIGLLDEPLLIDIPY